MATNRGMLAFRIDYEGVPGMTRREWEHALQPGYRAMATSHHKDNLPRHFTTQGATKYGYTRRSGEGMLGRKGFWSSYTGKKLRMKGHMLPLMFSGRSKALTLGMRDIRMMRSGARLVIHARAFNFRNPHSRVDMRREITMITPDEADALVRVHEETTKQQLLSRYVTLRRSVTV